MKKRNQNQSVCMLQNFDYNVFEQYLIYIALYWRTWRKLRITNDIRFMTLRYCRQCHRRVSQKQNHSVCLFCTCSLHSSGKKGKTIKLVFSIQGFLYCLYSRFITYSALSDNFFRYFFDSFCLAPQLSLSQNWQIYCLRRYIRVMGWI